MRLVDELSPTAEIAGATNAVLLRENGSLFPDQFDGAGFVPGACCARDSSRPANARSWSATAVSVRRSRPRWRASESSTPPDRNEGRRPTSCRRRSNRTRFPTSGTWCSKSEVTPFLQAAKDKGCIIQVGSDMLFEMIPLAWSSSACAWRQPSLTGPAYCRSVCRDGVVRSVALRPRCVGGRSGVTLAAKPSAFCCARAGPVQRLRCALAAAQPPSR
jgi:hypothetical protein